MGKSAGLTYRTIFLEEHGKLCNEDIQCILDKGICFRETGIIEKPVYLGIGPDMKASYFIGADWLDEKEGLSVVVHPKKEMENVDYFKMFMACLENELSSDLNQAFITGFKVGAPFIAFTIVFYAGMGLVSRLMPQLNIFFLSLPLQIYLGLGLLFITLPIMIMWFIRYFENGLNRFLH